MDGPRSTVTSFQLIAIDIMSTPALGNQIKDIHTNKRKKSKFCDIGLITTDLMKKRLWLLLYGKTQIGPINLLFSSSSLLQMISLVIVEKDIIMTIN